MEGEVAIEQLKKMNIDLLNVKPESHDRLVAYYNLKEDKEKIMSGIQNEIQGAGKPTEFHNLAIENHNKHVNAVLQTPQFTLGKDVCNCGERACYKSNAMIDTAAFGKVQTEAPTSSNSFRALQTQLGKLNF